MISIAQLILEDSLYLKLKRRYGLIRRINNAKISGSFRK